MMSERVPLRRLLLVALAGLVCLAPSTRAIGDVHGTEAAEVRIGGRGRIIEAGQAAQVRTAATCKPGYEVLESFVTVTQEGAWGQGSFTPECDGSIQRFVVTVSSFGDPFQPGTAVASAYILVQNTETGETDDDGANRTIRLQG
jgi:hypothetical protein